MARLRIFCANKQRSSLPVNLLLGSFQRVAHQRDDGHRTNTTRNGSDERALGSYLVVLHVAQQFPTTLGLVARNTGDTNVDNRRTLFDHIGCYELRFTQRCNHDISLSYNLFQVRCATVAERYGAIPTLLRE